MSDFGLSLPLGWLAGAVRKLMPPVITFGGSAQRARNDNESFLHVAITLRPRWRVGPSSIPLCQVFLDLYEGEKRVNSLPLMWGDLLYVEPAQHEHLRADHVSWVAVAWRAENAELGYFTDARFLKKPSERVSPIHPGKSRFKLRIKSGAFQRESPHFYLVRCPEAGASNGQFSVEFEFEGGGSVGPTRVLTTASKLKQPPPAPAPTPATIPVRVPTPYEIETKLRHLDFCLRFIRHDLEEVDAKAGPLYEECFGGFSARSASADPFLDTLTQYRSEAAARIVQLEKWRSENPHADIRGLTDPTWGQGIMSAADNFIKTYTILCPNLVPGTTRETFLHVMGPRIFAFQQAHHALKVWRRDAISRLTKLRADTAA